MSVDTICARILVTRCSSLLLPIAGADPASSVLHEVPRNHSEELATPTGVQQGSCFDICDTEGDQNLLKIVLRSVAFFSVVKTRCEEFWSWIVSHVHIYMSPRFQRPADLGGSKQMASFTPNPQPLNLNPLRPSGGWSTHPTCLLADNLYPHSSNNAVRTYFVKQDPCFASPRYPQYALKNKQNNPYLHHVARGV